MLSNVLQKISPFVVCATVHFHQSSRSIIHTVPKWEAGVHVGTYSTRRSFTPHAIGSRNDTPGFRPFPEAVFPEQVVLFGWCSVWFPWQVTDLFINFLFTGSKEIFAFNASGKEFCSNVLTGLQLGSNWRHVKWEPLYFCRAALCER